MIISFTSDSKCAAENTCCKPRPPTCYHGYQLPRPQNGRKICTREFLAVAVYWWVWASGFQYQPSPWAISVRSVILASGFSSFCWTGGGWYQWRCWMLLKSTGIHGRLRDTQRLSDWRPMQATKQWHRRHTGITLQPILTQYTLWHWYLLSKKVVFLIPLCTVKPYCVAMAIMWFWLLLYNIYIANHYKR